MRALKWLPWLLTAASVAVTGVVAAQSGERPTKIYVVDFMKVDDFADSELDPFGFLAEVHPEADPEAIEQETLASRRMVRGEIWYRIDHLE